MTTRSASPRLPRTFFPLLLLTLLLAADILGCAQVPAPATGPDLRPTTLGARARRTAHFTNYRRTEAGFSPEEEAFIENNCGPALGKPATDPAWNHGPTHFVVRKGYVLQHSSVDKIPLWVCEGLTPAQLSGEGDRAHSAFAPDPLLEPGERAELRDYRGSGFDRGHQAPAADFKCCQDLTDQSFCLSNMVPQSPANNRGVWASLEGKVRDWVALKETLYVVTGPMFYDPAEDDAATADGAIEFDQIGPGGVAVPTHLFKIVVAKAADGEWESVAFVLRNDTYERPFDFSAMTQSIDWIEERTGLDFFPELDPIEARNLESQRATPW